MFGGPTLTIDGHKLVLSTDGGPLGDREDDEALHDEPSDGARLLRPQSMGTKWRYLWVYDVDHKVVAMWRVSDGSEKVWSTANQEVMRIHRLDQKGQLNRVSHSFFLKVEAHMQRVEHETLETLKKIVEDAKGDRERKIDQIVRGAFKRHLAELERDLASAEKGAIPIGFKPYDPTRNVERQMAVFVITRFFKRHLDAEKIVLEVAEAVPSFDPQSAGHYQDVEWAIEDVREQTFEKYLPKRV